MSAIKLGAHHDRFRRRSTRGRHWRALFRRRFEAGFNAWKAGTGSPYDLLADDATWTIVGRSLASRPTAAAKPS